MGMTITAGTSWVAIHRTRVGVARRRLRSAITLLPRSAWSWWTGLDPTERVLYRAVVLLGSGCGLVYIPLGLIVPGLLFALTFFAVSLRRA